MEITAILRRLWRRRILGSIGPLLAVGAWLLVGSAPSQQLGLASGRVLVSLPRTQVVGTNPTGTERLPSHAPLLADMLATASGRQAIAAAAGIPVSQLAVAVQALLSPLVATPLPLAASKAGLATGATYSLVLNPLSGVVPLVEIDAAAPTASGAQRLVVAAERAMADMAARGVQPPAHGLVVTPVSNVQAHVVHRGTRRLYKAAVALVVFLLWSFVVLVIPARRPGRGRQRWRRRLITGGVCTTVGVIAAVVSITTISVLPPHIARRQLAVATAQAHILVDGAPASDPSQNPSTILDPGAQSRDVATLIGRGELLGSLMTSAPVEADIAAQAHISPNGLDAYEGPIPGVPTQLTEASSQKRSSQLVNLRRPYLLEVQPRRTNPVIDVYAQAPTPAAAQRLAAAAVSGLAKYVHDLARQEGLPASAPQTHLLTVGSIVGAQVSSGTKVIAGLTFVTAFLMCWGGLSLLRWWRRRGERNGSSPTRDRIASARASGGDWPHTTRVLPWLLALFVAMLWLVPFDQIQLNGNLPIGLPLDRLILPLIIGIWIIAIVMGGPTAPRRRLTWIHAAVGLFAVCALLSVVLNAPSLDHTLELTAGLKRVPLFISYLSLFVIVASVVRRSEVEAFLKYMLFLAVVLAVGMIVEYRTGYNVFYDLSHKIFPSVFKWVSEDTGGVDTIGRRATLGSSGQPLEAVTMLSVGIAIAFAMLLRAREWRPRILYSIALGLLFAAAVATARKSSLFAPGAIILTLAWFRPKQMLRFAPLGLLLVAAIHVAAPGATGTVTAQVSSKLNVSTVDVRVVRYDAVRPDVWSHLAFGRGLGTYNHVSHRILDSEFLGRLIETGVFGTVAYFLMMAAVVAVAARVIRSRDPSTATPALAAACVAAAFTMLSFLYDTLSFPHGSYLFLLMAGLLVAVRDGRRPAAVAVDGIRADRRVRTRDRGYDSHATRGGERPAARPVLSRAQPTDVTPAPTVAGAPHGADGPAGATALEAAPADTAAALPSGRRRRGGRQSPQALSRRAAYRVALLAMSGVLAGRALLIRRH